MSLNEINYQANPGINPSNNARINNLTIGEGMFYYPSSGTPGQVLQLNGSGIPAWVDYSSTVPFASTSYMQISLTTPYAFANSTFVDVNGFGLDVFSADGAFNFTGGNTITVNQNGRYMILVTLSVQIKNYVCYGAINVYYPETDSTTILNPTLMSYPGTSNSSQPTTYASFGFMTMADLPIGAKLNLVTKTGGNGGLTLDTTTRFCIVKV